MSEDTVYQSLKNLDVMELVTKKATTIKDLDKTLKQLAAFEVSKNAERAKMAKVIEKVQGQLHTISVVDQLLKEKDF